MMKSYETIWEVFNECANNQMRDIFFEEIEVEDTDRYVQAKFKDPNSVIEKKEMEDGSIVYDINTSGVLQRMTFTPI